MKSAPCFARRTVGIFLTLVAGAALWGQERMLTRERLQELLQRYPAADANRDGVLTEQEAMAYAATLRAGKTKASDSSASASVAPAPTLAEVSYGPHARNVLDFWRAKSDRPTPVVIQIHGGGFVGGDKSGIRRDRIVQECLDAGVSFAAINYRYLAPGTALQDILRDCARALQFIRWKASEWNVDKARIAAYGGSAGAGTSLWLAVHDDLADPASPDPVLRESTRIVCAGSNQGQFSYDLVKWSDLFGEDVARTFRGRLAPKDYYGFAAESDLHTAEGKKVRADCDMMGLISKDDPPIFISSLLPDLSLDSNNKFLHHPKHGKAVYDRLREVGVPVVANIPAMEIAPPPDGPRNLRDFLFAHLGVGRSSATTPAVNATR